MLFAISLSNYHRAPEIAAELSESVQWNLGLRTVY